VAARLEQLAPEVVFAGEAELAALGRAPTVETMVVQRGAAGIAVVREGRRAEHAADAAEVVDTTGAGDALAAGFLVGGVEEALAAAARCIAKAGAMP
jgi:ribokinase